jgi:hypothetical protein
MTYLGEVWVDARNEEVRGKHDNQSARSSGDSCGIVRGAADGSPQTVWLQVSERTASVPVATSKKPTAAAGTEIRLTLLSAWPLPRE